MTDNKQPNEAPRVYIYSRADEVSVFGYTEEYLESTVEQQANSLRLELQDQRHKIVADIREARNDGISTPILQQMLTDAANGRFDTMYIMDSERLSRDWDKCISIVEDLDRQGIEVVSLQEGCLNIPEEPGELSKLQIAQLKQRADAIARGEMPYATMDEVFSDVEDALQKDRKRNARRRKAQLKLLQRKRLMGNLGLQAGCVYQRHRDKIQRYCGYMRTGNVKHFVSTRPRRKTKSRDRYGSVYTPPKRDIVRINRMEDDNTDQV